MSESGFDRTIDLTRRCMRVMGVWPEHQKNIFSHIRFFFFTVSLLVFVLIPQTVKLYMVRDNLNDCMEVLTIGLLYLFIAYDKMLTIWLKQAGKGF